MLRHTKPRACPSGSYNRFLPVVVRSSAQGACGAFLTQIPSELREKPMFTVRVITLL
ncbi:MAG: hypothetical protein GF311_09800 [Candidatus Lokiarchaeota archaeon]|nr:hypothetical protein [Candidatus Lokiarchaeota archaeon]